MSKLEAGIFCEDIGLRPLSTKEAQVTALDYSEQLRYGLKGKPSSLSMFPSLLSPVELGSLKERSRALVVEIGGTNIYGAMVEVRRGRPVVISGHQAALPGTRYQDAPHFFDSVASAVKHLADGEKPDGVGIVYSFPGEARRTSAGVDMASPEVLPKEFAIPGISRDLVGESFRRALGRVQGTTFRDTPIAVLNDTVAVLFSEGAKIGGVVGTGFNIAAATEQGIFNTESGGFNGVPSHYLADRVDGNSSRPGSGLAEKQIGGLYLGQQMVEATRMVADRLGLNIDPELVTAATISELLEGRIQGPQVEVLTEVAKRLRDRSAQIVGIMMGTIARAFPEIFPEREVIVPVEGSVFWGIPNYPQIATEAARQVSGKQFQFLNVENAGRVGAAVAALSMVR